MRKLLCVLLGWVLGTVVGGESWAEQPSSLPVHSITDISHEFSFYFDGRFARNYLTGPNDADARNWATLHKCDLTSANLLVLASGASPCAYLPQDITAVRTFLQDGGGVVILGEFAVFRGQKDYPPNRLAKALGAEFVAIPAQPPLAAAAKLKVAEVRSYNGKTITVAKPRDWNVLVRDAAGRVVMARRSVGKGQLLVCSRALAGHRPDAKDPINAELWQSLLHDLARNRPVDPHQRPKNTKPENEVVRGGLRIQFTDYLQPYAEAIFDVYQRSRPVQEKILGVPPASRMLSGLILLPTGDGGFSNGRDIGLGVWWGGFPERQYGMVELLGHECTHSWVLPFAEPMWNEGLATYVGIQLGRELGYAAEADTSLKNWLEKARRDDPEMTKFDLAGSAEVPHNVRMGKPMWIWETLRKEKPDLLVRYFQMKRRLADPARIKQYTADDCVAVLSEAMGRDLFPWFQSIGVKVERSRATIRTSATPPGKQ